jgi:allantoate deiminase/N-carbamoyl-L-amino-acid hydrolase
MSGFGARLLDMADRLAEWSQTSGELTCVFLSEPHRSVAVQLTQWMQAAGMQATVDAAANVVGRYSGADTNARTLIIGSHYDTVHNAGKYDGRFGILAGLLAIEQLHRTGRRLPFHIELVAFSEEEGVRFARPFIGSSAIAGRFDPATLQLADASGIRMVDALRAAGLDPDAIPSLARDPNELLGYLELHIEQGPVLLRENLPVGIVTDIAGALRHRVDVEGTAGHAGTVPMTGRHDAAAAAAEIVLYVERRCAQAPTLVGTVGQLSVPNGATNVIPSHCALSLDIRAGDDATRDAAASDVLAEIARIAERRGVKIAVHEAHRAPAVPCAPRFQALLTDAIAQTGIRPVSLTSGAGHDAMMFGGITDVGMLFVRCGHGGVSHSPLETITAEDANLAVLVLLDFLERLAVA